MQNDNARFTLAIEGNALSKGAIHLPVGFVTSDICIKWIGKAKGGLSIGVNG